MTVIKHLDFEIPLQGEFAQPPFRTERYQDQVMALQPTAYWRLEEITGKTIADAVPPHTYTGTLLPHDGLNWTGGTLGQNGVPGIRGSYALRFDGTSGHLDFGDVLNPGTTSYSVNLWVKRTSTAHTQFILTKGNRTSTYPGFSIFFNANEGLLFLRCNGGSGTNTTQRAGQVCSTRPVLDNDWHMITLVIDRDADLIRGYLDGSDDGFEAGGGGAVSDVITDFDIRSIDTLTLGANTQDADLWFATDAYHDEISIFQGRALKPSEISRLFQTGIAMLSIDSIEQRSDLSMPDRTGPHPGCLQVVLKENQLGRFVETELEPATATYQVRLAFNCQAMTAGYSTLAQTLDADGDVVWSMRFDSSLQQVQVRTPYGDQLTCKLHGAALAWHIATVTYDAASDAISLSLDGLEEVTRTTLHALEPITTLRLGSVSRSDDATGELLLDEAVVSNGSAGPVIVLPDQDHAADPSRWLVLYNANVPGSDQWADRYRALRNIPYANLVALDVSTQETIDSAAYLELEQQVTGYINRHGLSNQIMGILCGYGVPGYAHLFGTSNAYAMAALLHHPIGETPGTTNPIHETTSNITRPTIASLMGRYMTARLDAPSLTDALDHLDRIEHQPVLEAFDSTHTKLFVDPHTSAAPSSVQWIDQTRSWANSIDAANLGLLIETTTQQTTAELSDFQAIHHDALYFGYAAGHMPTITDPPGPRWLAVENYADNVTSHSLRRTTGETATERFLQAGYLAVASSSVTLSTADLPLAAPLFEALRRGWTLAEAWMLALPTLRIAGHLVGDPFMTIKTPREGWRLWGPLKSLTALDPQHPMRRLRSSQTTLALGDLDKPLDETSAFYVLRRMDEHGRETPAAAPLRLTAINGELHPTPARAFWPNRSSWLPGRKGQQLQLSLHTARRFDHARVHIVTLETQTVGGESKVIATVTPPPANREINLNLPLPQQPQRYRWCLTSPVGAAIKGPWSAYVEPAPAGDQHWDTFGGQR